MPTLTVCKGLPGSGKTTWAKDQMEQRRIAIYGGTGVEFPVSVQPPIARVNKDDIRTELETKGWQWSHENEKDVVMIRDSRIRQALTSGYDVISDDTNFGKHEQRLRELAKECNADFALDDHFCQVPIEKCIRRDAQRVGKAKVGEEVIRKMAKQNGIAQVNPAKYTPNPEAMKAIICDIDGTLALNTGRSPYDPTLYHTDTPNLPAIAVIRIFHDIKLWQIVYVSGRDDTYYKVTRDWLVDHNCPPGPLHMRTAGDKREDSIIKSELFDRHVRDRYNVQFVLDDRDRVVKMWRSMGLAVFQVNEGNF